MKKLNYCTCGLNTKRTFSNFYLAWGVLINVCVFVAILVVFQYEILLFMFVIVLVQILRYNDYFRKAIYLKHTVECAKRYAVLATIAQDVAHTEDYGYLSNYKSISQCMTKKIWKSITK